ncbi:hypothetical protein DIPPA_23903 [Diplonema papillatum]|nr:hypothetical protein DIPPA_23903 [Diplonema papillatum]
MWKVQEALLSAADPFLQYLRRPEDDEVQSVRKVIYPLFLLLTAVTGGLMAGLRALGDSYSISFVGAATYVPLASVMFGYVCCVRHVSDRAVLVLLSVCVVIIAAFDYDGASSNTYRPWPFLVLLADLLLVCKLPMYASTVLILVSVAWLFVNQLELVFRFGWYDAPLVTVPYADRMAKCACEKPPCEMEVVDGLLEFVMTSFVFLLDFVFTRGFAERVYQEQARMQSSISAAKTVSELLVQFRLSEAETSLAGSSGVPQELVAVLLSLLQNLRRYEPYLPQSCLPSAESASSDEVEVDFEDNIYPLPSPGGSSFSTGTSVSHKVSSKLKPIGLLLGQELTRRCVTVHSLNARDTLKLVETSTTRDRVRRVEMLQQVLLQQCLAAIGVSRGILESFMGDRITSSWNASRPCLSHRHMAAQAACQISSSLTERSIVTHAGLACGEALCGNVGIESLMRYNIVGEVSSLAHDLTPVAKDWNIAILVDTKVANDVSASFNLRVVLERVMYTKRGRDSGLVLWELLCSVDGVGEEWMYTLASDSAQRTAFENALSIAFLRSDPITVSTMLTSVSDKSLLASQHVQLISRSVAEESVDDVVRLPVVAPRTARPLPASER